MIAACNRDLPTCHEKVVAREWIFNVVLEPCGRSAFVFSATTTSIRVQCGSDRSAAPILQANQSASKNVSTILRVWCQTAGRRYPESNNSLRDTGRSVSAAG